MHFAADRKSIASKREKEREIDRGGNREAERKA